VGPVDAATGLLASRVRQCRCTTRLGHFTPLTAIPTGEDG